MPIAAMSRIGSAARQAAQIRALLMKHTEAHMTAFSITTGPRAQHGTVQSSSPHSNCGLRIGPLAQLCPETLWHAVETGWRSTEPAALSLAPLRVLQLSGSSEKALVTSARMKDEIAAPQRP